MACVFGVGKRFCRDGLTPSLLITLLLWFGLTGTAQAAELTFNRIYQGSLSGQTFTTTSQLAADAGSVRFSDGGTQRAFQNTSGTLTYTVGGVLHSETGVLNSRYPNGNTLMNAVAFSGTGGDRLLVLGGAYAGSAGYSGSSNAIVAKLNEYIDATAPDPAQTTLLVNGGSSASVAVGQSATIVVTVKLGSGSGVSGATVSLSASPSGASSISPSTATTDSGGQATFTVQGLSSGSVTYKAVASANGTTTTSSGSVTVTFVGVRSAAQSSAVVPGGTVGAATTVTISVRDGSGTPVAGAASALSVAIGGINAGVSPSAITDAGGGSYTFTYVPTAAGTDSIAIRLDGTAISGSPYSSVVTAPTLVFTPGPGALPAGSAGTAYSQTVSVLGGTAPYSFSASGLPVGLTINASTGAITGAPTTVGSYSVTVSSLDAHNVAGSVAYTIAVAAQAPVANAVSATVAANSANTPITLAITGGTPTSVAAASQPAHGTASASGTTITYTPVAGYSGSDSFTYTATNASGTSAPGTVSVTVSAPMLVFTPAPGGLPVGTAGNAYSQTIAVSGGTLPYSFTANGLPAGLTINPSTGAISGTPTSGGTSSATVHATDACGVSSQATYSIAVAEQMPVANAVSVTVAANSSGNAVPLSVSGGAAASVGVASPAAHGTAVASGTTITYTPAAGYSGSDSFTYTATNASGTSTPATVSISVTATPLIFAPTPGALPNGVVGTAYSQAISVSGGTAPYSITATGLPPGLAIQTSSATVAGTPTTAGTYTVTLSATDAHGAASVATYSVTIAPEAPVANAVALSVAANSANNAVTLALSGGAASVVTVAGAPSHGTASASGTSITYTPAAGYSGTDSFTYTASNASVTSAPATVTVTVAAPALVFAPASGALPGGTATVAYNQTIAVAGGSGPYSFVATGLPGGLSIDPASGAVAGTPTTPGSYSVAISVTDAHGATGSATYALTIAVPPPPTAADSTSTSVPANTTTQAGQNVGINLSSLVSGDYTEIRIITQPKHGRVAISRTVAMRLGGTPLMMMAMLTTAGVQIPSQVMAVYTPDANYQGADSFQFAAVGPGGVSAAATVAINVVGRAPTARTQTVSTIDGQPVSVELTAGASDGPFTGATILSVSPSDQASAAIVPAGAEGARTFRLDVTPKAHFGGAITIAFTLSNAFGTSAPATVTVTVNRRADPTADPIVQAVSDAQAEAARRFARAQTSNFMQRAESLHDACARSVNGVRLGSTDGSYDPRASRDGQRAASDASDPKRASEERERADTQARAATDSDRCNGTVAVWTGGTVEVGTRDAVTRRSKISATTSGVSAGIDVRLAKRLAVGIGGGLGHDSSAIADGKGHVAADSKTVALYASLVPMPGMFVDGALAHGWLDFATRRSDPTTSALASAQRTGRFTTGALAAGIERVSGRLQWSLYGRADYLTGTLDAYREQGAGLYDLRFDERRLRSATGALGFRAAYRRPLSFGSMAATLRGEWQHEFTNGGRQGLDYADVTGPSFYGFATQGWSREQFMVSPGVALTLPSAWEIGISMGLRAASGERAASTNVQVRKQF